MEKVKQATSNLVVDLPKHVCLSVSLSVCFQYIYIFFLQYIYIHINIEARNHIFFHGTIYPNQQCPWNLQVEEGGPV